MTPSGVLLMNVGTPDEPTVESVREYLREFLLDPDVIDIPTPLRHLLVRGIILRTRPRKIAPSYQSIWMEEGSPLRVYTDRMASALQEALGMPCEVGMRYGNPSIRQGLQNLRDSGVERVLLAPLFPHHAQATTESSLKFAYRQMDEMGWSPEISELDHFEKDPSFIGPLVESIRPHMDEDTHLLFSYHGLPLSHIYRADKTGSHCQKVDNCCTIPTDANSSCYAHHCTMTTLAVVEELGIDDDSWSQSYQSRLGPVKWLRPSSIEKVDQLVDSGIKKLTIVSPAFLADGLETLEEIDIEMRNQFIERGGEEMELVSCLNDRPDWIEGMSQLVRSALNSDEPQGSES
jgi:ferrochelatase